MRHSLVLFIAVALNFIAGCAAPLPTILDVDVNNMTDEQAVLIFSTGAVDTCMSAATAINIKRAGAEPTFGESFGFFQTNNPFVKSDFDDEYGKVYTTLLAPGDYDFWRSVNNPYYKFVVPEFTESIRLNPGEIKYIGEFFVAGCGAVVITIKDRSERDLAYVQGIEPNLDLEKVSIDLIRISGSAPTDDS